MAACLRSVLHFLIHLPLGGSKTQGWFLFWEVDSFPPTISSAWKLLPNNLFILQGTWVFWGKTECCCITSYYYLRDSFLCFSVDSSLTNVLHHRKACRLFITHHSAYSLRQFPAIVISSLWTSSACRTDLGSASPEVDCRIPLVHTRPLNWKPDLRDPQYVSRFNREMQILLRFVQIQQSACVSKWMTAHPSP